MSALDQFSFIPNQQGKSSLDGFSFISGQQSKQQQPYIPAPEIPIDVPQDEPVPGFVTNVAKDVSGIMGNYVTGAAQAYQEHIRSSDAAGQAFVNTLTRQGTMDDYRAAVEREGRANRQFVRDVAGTPAIVGAIAGVPGAGILAGPIVARDMYDAAMSRYDQEGVGAAAKQAAGDITGIGPLVEEAPKLITPDYWQQAYEQPITTVGNTAMAFAPAALIGKGVYKGAKHVVNEKVNKALDEFDFTIQDTPQSSSSAFLRAIANQESGGNEKAYNPDGQAMGRYQFQQGTWDQAARLAGRDDLVGVDPRKASGREQDVVAEAYADYLLNRYNGDSRYAAAAWYAGEGNADAYFKRGSFPTAKEGNYPSIAEYVDSVTGRMKETGFAPEGLSRRDYELTDLPEYNNLLARLQDIGEKKWDAAELNTNSRSSFDYTNVKNPEKTSLAGDGILFGEQPPKQPERIIMPGESTANPEAVKIVNALKEQARIDAEVARAKGDPYQMFMDARAAGDYYRAARWAEILGSKDWAEQYRRLWWKEQGFKDDPAIDLKRVQPTVADMRPEINQFMADTTNRIAVDRANARQDLTGVLNRVGQQKWDAAERLGQQRDYMKASEAPHMPIIDEGFKEKPAYKYAKMDPISEADAVTYHQATGLNLNGYRHEITSHEVKHALKQHGGDSERLRGQIPITREDFSLLPEITRPENIIGVEKGKRKQDIILYEKRVNGHILAVEEVLVGRQTLRFLSMRKRPSAQLNVGRNTDPVSHVQDGRSLASSDSSVPNLPPSVNGKEYMAATSGMTVPANSPRPVNPSGEAVTGTVTRKQIVDKVNDFFTKVSTGRLGIRGVLGWFDRNSEVVRTKDYADFRTIMHEIGHYLDKGLGLRKDSSFDAELLSAVQRRFGDAYNDLPVTGRRGEGIAEFFHDYTTNPSRAKKEFPQYYASFEQRLAQEPFIRAKVNEVQQMLHTWYNQSSEARGRGSITRERDRTPKSIMEQARNLWFQFREKLIDDKVGLSDFVTEFEKLIGKKLAFEENPHMQSRLAISSATARAQMVVENKSPALVREVLNRVYGKDALSYDVTMRSILDGLENNKELNRKYPNYLKNGNFEDWTAALDTYLVAQRQLEIQKLKHGYKGSMHPADAKGIIDNAPAELREAANKFYKYNDNLLRLEVNGGLISPETYVELVSKHKFYASMVRDFETGESSTPAKAGGKSFGNVKSTLKSLSDGGDAHNVESPIESSIIHTYDVFNRIERNKVAQTFAKLAKEAGVGRLVENVSGKARASEYVFTVMERGVERAYETTPETYRAIMSMNQEGSNIIVKILSVPAGWLRAGATLTPDFVLRNLGRDTFSAAVYSKHGFVPIFDTIKGLSLLMRDSKLHTEYQASGAQMATLVSMDRNHVNQSINKLIKNNMISKANPIEWLRAFSDVAETATRLAEFKKARGAGKSIQEAGLEAKDITVDFNRAGTAGRKFNQISAFFNAAVQGTDRMARAFREDPIGFNVRATMWVTMPSLVLWMINHDQKWYQDEEDWVKNTCWMFKTGDTVWRMPKPPGLGQIYGSSVETALNYYYQRDPKRVKAWAEETLFNLLPGIGITAVEPMVENLANYSFFTGKPIVPLQEQNWTPDQQFGPYTSETAKFIGKHLNVSPRKVDNAIQGYTASLGKMATTGVDYAAGKYEGLPEQQIKNLPGFRSVMSSPFQRSQAIQDFYDEYQEQKALYNKFKQTGTIPEDYDPARYARLKSVDSLMDKLHQQQKLILNSTSISPAEKRQRLDALQMKSIEYARAALWKPAINR